MSGRTSPPCSAARGDATRDALRGDATRSTAPYASRQARCAARPLRCGTFGWRRRRAEYEVQTLFSESYLTEHNVDLAVTVPGGAPAPGTGPTAATSAPGLGSCQQATAPTAALWGPGPHGPSSHGHLAYNLATCKMQRAPPQRATCNVSPYHNQRRVCRYRDLKETINYITSHVIGCGISVAQPPLRARA